MELKIYEHIASRAAARLNCANDRPEWFAKHEAAADALCKAHMPIGSGFNCGTSIDWGRTTGDKLVFVTEFHHMNEHGYYDGWTQHVVTVRPSLVYGFTLHISGRDRNGIKEYIYQVFADALRRKVDDAI